MRITPRAGSSPAFGTKHPSARRFYFNEGNLPILSFKKIFGIIITGSLLGIFANYFNPEGIPLLREKMNIEWVSDSLLIKIDSSYSAETADSNSLSSVNPLLKNSEQVKDTEKKTYNEADQNQKMIEKVKPLEPEVVAFTEPKAITLEQAYSLFNKGVKFIDARDEADYLVGHITNSINIPFDDFDNHEQKLDKLSKDEPLVIYCAGTDCDLSILLGNKLFDMGYKQVYVFFGGWLDWINNNFPTEKSSE